MKICYAITASVLFSLFFTNQAVAQYTIAPSFTVLKGADGNKPVLIGGGLQAAYTVTSHVQLGIAYNLYPAKTRNKLMGTIETRYKDRASNLAVTAAYLFLPSSAVLRPFAGADVGINFARQNVYFFNVTTSTVEWRRSVKNLLLSPKAGFSFRINKWLSIAPQAQYHFSTQKVKKDLIGSTNTGTPIEVWPIQNFYTLSASAAIHF